MTEEYEFKIVVSNPSTSGIWSWETDPIGFADGFSREPLLDACRRLKRMGVPTASRLAMFHAGEKNWALRTTVGGGAALTVSERLRRGPTFNPFKPWVPLP